MHFLYFTNEQIVFFSFYNLWKALKEKNIGYLVLGRILLLLYIYDVTCSLVFYYLFQDIYPVDRWSSRPEAVLKISQYFFCLLL